jgi:excisionase family DNA binding protein
MTLLSTDLPPKSERVERSVDRNVESRLRTVGHSEARHGPSGEEPIAGGSDERRYQDKEIDMSTIPRRATPPETPHANDELLTIQEVADVVRVPVATLRYWRHLGSGPQSFRIGRSVRYWRSEVLQWLEKQSSHPHGSR